MSAPVFWLVGPPPARAGEAAELAAALGGRARVVTLGEPGRPEPSLDLGPRPDLGMALAAAPAEMRPAAAVRLAGGPTPRGWEGLPCPLLGWREGANASGVEADLPPEPDRAAARLLEAASRGRVFPWLEAVQVNLPLRDLLGRYRPLVERFWFHLEVGLDPIALDTLGPADLDQARELLAGRRLTAHLPFIDLCAASPDARVAALSVERLEAAAQWALDLGAGQAVAHLGYNPFIHRDLEAFVRRFGRGLAPLTRRLAEGGARLALENTFEPGPEPLLACRAALEEAAGLAVGCCLDVGHALAFSRTALDAWWEAMAPHLFEMHLHDNDGADDSHRPPGSGRADWAWLGRRLAGLAELPVLTLEPHVEGHLWASLRGLERLWGSPVDLGGARG